MDAWLRWERMAVKRPTQLGVLVVLFLQLATYLSHAAIIDNQVDPDSLRLTCDRPAAWICQGADLATSTRASWFQGKPNLEAELLGKQKIMDSFLERIRIAQIRAEAGSPLDPILAIDPMLAFESFIRRFLELKISQENALQSRYVAVAGKVLDAVKYDVSGVIESLGLSAAYWRGDLLKKIKHAELVSLSAVYDEYRQASSIQLKANQASVLMELGLICRQELNAASIVRDDREGNRLLVCPGSLKAADFAPISGPYYLTFVLAHELQHKVGLKAELDLDKSLHAKIKAATGKPPWEQFPVWIEQAQMGFKTWFGGRFDDHLQCLIKHHEGVISRSTFEGKFNHQYEEILADHVAAKALARAIKRLSQYGHLQSQAERQQFIKENLRVLCQPGLTPLDWLVQKMFSSHPPGDLRMKLIFEHVPALREISGCYAPPRKPSEQKVTCELH